MGGSIMQRIDQWRCGQSTYREAFIFHRHDAAQGHRRRGSCSGYGSIAESPAEAMGRQAYCTNFLRHARRAIAAHASLSLPCNVSAFLSLDLLEDILYDEFRYMLYIQSLEG